jgi:hypothetical protein
MRNSWRSHDRRRLPRILEMLEFRSNHEAHQTIIDALAVLKKYAPSKARYDLPEERVPVGGVVAATWMDAIYDEDKNGQRRINRVVYEICVLQILRERLRCQEIWIVSESLPQSR